MNLLETPATTVVPPQQPVAIPVSVSSPPKPEGYVMNTSSITVSPDRPFRSIVIFIIILLLTGVGSSSAYLGYKYLNNPQRILQNTFANFTKASSWTAKVDFAPKNTIVQFSLDYQKGFKELSKAELHIQGINKDVGKNASVVAIFDTHEAFIQTKYSEFNDLHTALLSRTPQLTQLKLYTLVTPIFTGDKWLHITFPPETTEKIESPANTSISKEKSQELEVAFNKALVIHTFDANFKQNDKTHYRIVFGFKKKELLDFLNLIKTLPLDIKLSQINTLIDAVNQADNWDSDMVEFLIAKQDDQLESVSLSLPDKFIQAFDKKALQEIPSSASGPLGDITQKLDQWFKPQTNNGLISIGKITFTNFNSTAVTAPPATLTEFTEVLAAIKDELPQLMVFVNTPPDTNLPTSPFPAPISTVTNPPVNSPVTNKFVSSGVVTIETGIIIFL